MSIFCFIKVFNSPSPIPRIMQFWELIPGAQFILLSFIWTQTAFYREYPLLMFLALSFVFYLINGKLVIACVTKVRMKLLHPELLFMLIPAFLLFLEKLNILETKLADKLQIIAGIFITIGFIERSISYSMSIVKQMTGFLGFGFFEMPKKKELPASAVNSVEQKNK